MKPLFEKVPLSKTSFLFKEEVFPYFDIPWHIHPEYELTLLVSAPGKIFVGDYIGDYIEGDIYFFGSDLPHLWKSEKNTNSHVARQVIIQFSQNFLGDGFFEKPEFTHIKMMLRNSLRGLKFDLITSQTIGKKMIAMLNMSDCDRLIELLSVLNIMASSNTYQMLSSPGFINSSNPTDMDRMNIIYKYVLDNFKKDISLNEIANVASLAPVSFSRYFKIRTKKTFSRFLNEVKIGCACKLLIEKELTVNQIADECGFNNLSNFNRQFKVITGLNPIAYQLQFKREN